MTTSSNQPTKKEPQRHAEQVAALRMAVLYSAGITEPGTREAAFSGGPLPLLVGEYVAKIRSTASYRITEEDIQHLLAAGYSQDAIFEITIAAALGAATQRLEAGLSALTQVD